MESFASCLWRRDRHSANYKQCRAWLEQIRQVVAQQNLPAEIRVQYTGRPAFVTEIAGGMEKDMGGSAGGTLLTIGILFYLTHRGFDRSSGC
jgi:predicted RND superfamily exporter protein